MANHNEPKDFLKELEHRFERHVRLAETAVETAVDKTIEFGAEVVDVTVDAAKKLGKDIVEGTEMVVDKTIELGAEAVDLTVDAAKELGREAVELGENIVEGAEELADDAIEFGAEVVDVTVDAAKAVGREVVELAHDGLELGAEAIVKTEDAVVAADKALVRFLRNVPKEYHRLVKRAYQRYKEAPAFFETIVNALKTEKDPEWIVFHVKAFLDGLGIPYTRVKFDAPNNHVDVHIPDALLCEIMSLIMSTDLKIDGMAIKFNGPTK